MIITGGIESAVAAATGLNVDINGDGESGRMGTRGNMEDQIHTDQAKGQEGMNDSFNGEDVGFGS